MSTPDQPNTPPLTRKQLRELRNTGATPVIAPATPHADSAPAAAPEASAPSVPQAPVAPLARAADPAPVHTAPVPDASVDLGAQPLTRRQARQQERIRTASVPVISTDPAPGPASGASPIRDAAATPDTAPFTSPPPAYSPPAAAPAFSVPAPTPSAASFRPAASPSAAPTTVIEPSPWERDEPATDTGWLRSAVGEAGEARAVEHPAPRVEPAPITLAPAPVDPATDRSVVNPQFGARLLHGRSAKAATAAASFEQLLIRDTASTGSVSAPSALILSHTSAAPLVAPIAGTGELLVTGTLTLPEGLGSTGHAPGTTDGREIDAALVDGELPALSSPTPIAASAAVSTIKTADEIIQPPSPERGSRLMLSLAITAGVLALALVGVLVYALTTGVIS